MTNEQLLQKYKHTTKLEMAREIESLQAMLKRIFSVASTVSKPALAPKKK